MTVRRLARPHRSVLAAVVLGAAAIGSFVVPRARATSGFETGWWWEGQQAPSQLPAPATVPDGGLWVSSNASGTFAVSAMRFTLTDTEAAPIVTLTVSSEQPANGANVIACPVTGGWTATTNGPWGSRPAYDCSKFALGTRGVGDTTAIAFDLSTIVTGKQVDVAFVPGPFVPPSGLPVDLEHPPVPVTLPPQANVSNLSPTFDVTFAAPGPTSVATFTVPASDDGNTGVPPAVEPVIGDTTVDTAPPFLFTPPVGPVAVAAPAPVRRRLPLAPTQPVATELPQGRTAARVLASLVFLALVAWWSDLATLGADERPGRPHLTLYDDPVRALARDTPRRSRPGPAPALR